MFEFFSLIYHILPLISYQFEALFPFCHFKLET